MRNGRELWGHNPFSHYFCSGHMSAGSLSPDLIQACKLCIARGRPKWVLGPTQAGRDSCHHEHMRSFLSAHSWPPAQQGTQRSAADLDFLFALPAAAELHRLLPGLGAVHQPGASARTGCPLDAPAQPSELDMQRRALRAMYRTRFQQASRLRCA